MSTEPDWRKIADERLAKMAAIAKIGAEPPDEVLAIIAGKEPDPSAGTSDTSTMYHHSTADFRRQLAASAENWHKRKEGYFDQVSTERQQDGGASVVLLDAYAGTMMAGSYAYTLAAVLGLAEREFGPQTARRLASAADDILENGDFDDMNADVQPGTPLPPPSPAEQQRAGQISIYDAIGAESGAS